MLTKLDKYWKEMFLLLSISTVMDPRFKMKYVEFLFSKFEGSDGNSQLSSVMKAIHSLYDDYPTDILEKEDSWTDSNSSNFEDEDSDSEEDTFSSEKRKEKVPKHVEERCRNPNEGPSLLQGYQQFILSASHPAKSELDWYLEEPVIQWSQDFSILDWWKGASLKYPTLSQMARDFLAIPISLRTSFDAYHTQG